MVGTLLSPYCRNPERLKFRAASCSRRAHPDGCRRDSAFYHLRDPGCVGLRGASPPKLTNIINFGESRNPKVPGMQRRAARFCRGAITPQCGREWSRPKPLETTSGTPGAQRLPREGRVKSVGIARAGSNRQAARSSSSSPVYGSRYGDPVLSCRQSRHSGPPQHLPQCTQYRLRCWWAVGWGFFCALIALSPIFSDPML